MTTTRQPPPWLENALDHVWLPYTQMKTVGTPLPVVATDGVKLTLADGRELVDGISSWWTACHGYNHPEILAAVSAQLHRMPHFMMGGAVHEQVSHLAERLAHLLPGDLNHVFFSESGSVSVEVGMKMAVQYWLNRGVTGRHRFVAFNGGYHGDTFATMSVCDPEEGMHSLFKGAVADQILVNLPTDSESAAKFDQVLAQHQTEIAAVVMEPLIQGAGGMVFHSPETVKAVREACDRYGILLILDEIMTGFGRTGSMFACQQSDVVPDIITLSKALTAGTLPLAATIARAYVFDAFLADDPDAALMHGPTQMGNALACAAANASLDLFEGEPRLDQVAAIEAHLQRALEPCRDVPGVVDVRVKGAVGVVQVQDLKDNDWLKRRFIDQGVWLRPFRDIIYTTPPFTIQDEELHKLTDVMVSTVSEWSAL